MNPTWESLAPLLHDSWEGNEGVLRCLADHAVFIDNVARSELRRRGVDPDGHDVFGAVYLALFEAFARRSGVGAERREDRAAGWFATRVRFLARKYAARERGRGQRHPPLDDTSFAVPAEPIPRAVSERDVRRALDLATARGVPPTQLLAFVARHAPRVLTRPLSAAAVAYRSGVGSAHGRQGLARSEPDTWRHLEPWIARNGDDPGSAVARTGLAWVLRSEDETCPERWAEAHPEEVKDALDLLRRWVSRAHAKLSAGR